MANSVTGSALLTQISARRFEASIDTGAILNISTSPRNIDAVSIDNSANSHISYLRIFNFDGSPAATLGSNSPDVILPVSASSSADFTFDPAVVFGTGIEIAVVQDAGTAGTTAPGNAVSVILLTS
tara:strand:+ start:3997 stop:4374 length:378 start_codon:yes stop_codon:yes gene_type:complete